MAAVQHRATTRTSNTDNSTTKTKSKATSARKSPATKRKRVSAETARAAAALKGLAVEAPAPSIEANEPGQFGRINVMDITPAEERGIFPARVELGEPFEMTAQVFIEGRTKVGVTAIVRNPRGKETMRRAMTCVNPGLDRWTVMVKCGEHSDLKPWEDGYAAVKRQLGEWTVTIEGWEDAVRLLAARRPRQGACDGRRGQRTQFRCRVAGPLGRNPGHRPDRTRSQDLGEGR